MNKLTPKTIEIFLPDGNPKSIKIASITSRNVEVSYIPRKKIAFAKDRKGLNGVGIYFLVGNSEERVKPEIYIGETGKLLNRISRHNLKQDFWQYAVLVTSRVDQFTRAHGKYLEWLSCEKAKQANRYFMHNAVSPSKPHVSESMEADLEDSFETISTLVSTLGVPVFQPIRTSQVDKGSTDEDVDDIFLIQGRGSQGTGAFTNDGFVIFSGSQLSNTLSPTIMKRNPKLRDRYLTEDMLEKHNDYILLKEDVICGSPSTAAALIVGHACNGWKHWKNNKGQTLDEIYRQNKNT